MNQDIQTLKDQMNQMQREIEMLKSFDRSHFHDGNSSQRVNFSDLMVIGPTITPYPTATTSVPAGGGNVVKPQQPSGTLSVQVGNVTYKLLYE